MQSGELMGALQQAMLRLEQASSLAALASLRLLSLFPDSPGPQRTLVPSASRLQLQYEIVPMCLCLVCVFNGAIANTKSFETNLRQMPACVHIYTQYAYIYIYIVLYM